MSLAAGTYTIDKEHTVIGFVTKHAMVTKVRGNFGEFEGTINVAENIADSTAEATIKAASISTGPRRPRKERRLLQRGGAPRAFLHHHQRQR